MYATQRRGGTEIFFGVFLTPKKQALLAKNNDLQKIKYFLRVSAAKFLIL